MLAHHSSGKGGDKACLGWFRKIGIIVGEEIRRDVRDRKMLALLFIYLVLLAIGLKYGYMLGVYARLAFIEGSYPVEIMVVYYLSAAIVPLFSLLLVFDSVSGEVSSRSAAYLVMRAGRGVVVLAKYFAAALMISAVSLVAFLVGMVYFNFRSGNMMLVEGLSAWAYLMVYSLAFLGLGVLCSTLSRKQNTSLWSSFSVVALLLLMSVRDLLAFLSPFDYVGRLFEGEAVLGVLSLFSFALVCIMISLLVFRRKDI